MIDTGNRSVAENFFEFISDKEYPCVAAKNAVSRRQIPSLVVGDMRCPKDDVRILSFLYDFIKTFRKKQSLFHSAAVIFEGPLDMDEKAFDRTLWQRLEALSRIDARTYAYDSRVSPDPSSPDFSFSLGEEAFFIIGLHPDSSRRARRFSYPTLIFNPHVQFEKLRQNGQYDKMRAIVRKRDAKFSGSVNPMLSDFGEQSEAKQYSGRQYDEPWTCPFITNYGKPQDYSSEK